MTQTYPIPRIKAFEGIAGRVQVLFHGINKSGSLAMSTVLRDAYAAAGRSQEFFSHYFLGISPADYIREASTRSGNDFLGGHYLYGSLPPRPDRVLITQFRHPLPRVLSCYNWVKRKCDKVGKPIPDLETWAEQTKGRAHSQVVQFGCGYGRYGKSLRNMPLQYIYESCIDAIEREVFCFGLAERFEESIFLFASLCGLPSVPPWVRDRRNPGRPLSSEIPDSTRRLIEEVFRYDFQLYAYALETFGKKVAGIDFGPGLEAYKQACADQYRDRLAG